MHTPHKRHGWLKFRKMRQDSGIAGPSGLRDRYPVPTGVFMGFLVALLLLVTVTAAQPAENYRFERMWPTLQQPWYFNHPNFLAVDRSGNVYVGDSSNFRIVKLTQDGQLITRWGNQEGNADGQFSFLYGIAVDRDGYVYAVDMGNQRIQKFDANGKFITKWGGYGQGDGQFDRPMGIAAGPFGDIYVTDTYNSRIQRFSADGRFISKWGGGGSGEGQFGEPRGIAVDGEGFVYVADSQNNRIQKFTADGQFVTMWGEQGWTEGKFNSPFGVAIDIEGNVLVTDSSNMIQKFSRNGVFLARWKNLDWWIGGSGNLGPPMGIAVGTNGYIYAADDGKNRIVKITPDGQSIAAVWSSNGKGPGYFDRPAGVALDSQGYIYVMDRFNNRIQKFSPDGAFVKTWGSWGYGAEQFAYSTGIAISDADRIYIANAMGDNIKEYTTDGEYVRTIGTTGTGNGQFTTANAVAVDPQGNLYVTDNMHRVQKFTADGQFITAWGSQGDGDGQFDWPFGIAVDGTGFVYVAEKHNHRVQKFTADGQFVTKWGGLNNSNEDSDDLFQDLQGIAVDRHGYVYVLDVRFMRDRTTIKKFSPEGVLIEKWSRGGVGPGQLGSPEGIYLAADDRMYIADTNNNRIQVFKPVSTAANARAVIVAGGGPYPGNDLWDATQMAANFAYRTLTYQGYEKQNIRYLSANTTLDLDENGLADDVAGEANGANLRNAIIDWAADADSLVIYLADHGGNGTFRLNGSETLSAAAFASWLDTLQTARNISVTIIYDACESGSFVAALSPPPAGRQRVVLTSTSPGEKAFFITQGSISFSNFLWTHIFNGHSLGEAFDLTTQAMTAYQHPQLDGNGNGKGNETDDSTVAQNLYIGNGTQINGGAPVIGAVSEPQTVTGGGGTAVIYADPVTDGDGIARVWAVIRPPDYQPGPAGNPVQDLPSLEMTPAGGSRYEGSYTGFTASGTYQIAVYARDRLGNTSAPRLTTVSVNDPAARKAVIIAAGDPTGNLWPALEASAGLAYNSLIFQGYNDDNVYFLSSASFSAGVDGTPTLANVQYALANWAKSNTQDMVVYLIGEGGSGSFPLHGTESLPAASLKTWLDELQDAIPGKVVVVCDAPLAASFLAALKPPAGKIRILIAGAGRNQGAHFLSGGNISFSRFFWSRVANGMNVRDAFLHAKKAMAFLVNKQEAAIDDNGNGVFNEKADGATALNTHIGWGITLAGDDPVIGSISPAQTVTGGQTVCFWVQNVTTTGTIAKVWAVITPPEKEGGGISGAVTDLPTVELTFNAGTGRYEGSHAAWTSAGVYTIAVYARDAEGNISLPLTTTVTQTLGPDPYEPDDNRGQASVITLNAATPQAHNFHAAGDEDWVQFYGIKDVIYEIKVANPGSRADAVLELYGGDDGNLETGPVDDGGPGEGELLTWMAPKSGRYYVRIRNYDPAIFGADTGYELKIYRPIAPDIIGVIQGIVISNTSQTAIANAVVLAGLGSALTQNGGFTLLTGSGTTAVEVIAAGYLPLTVPDVEVTAGQVTTLALSLTPDSAIPDDQKGDIDGTGGITMVDLILALQAVAGQSPAGIRNDYAASGADVNGDGRIGMAEVLYIMQSLGGPRVKGL